MKHKLQIYKGKKGWWYIRIVARNGKIVADGGEAYSPDQTPYVQENA